jgi:hypothetical protein
LEISRHTPIALGTSGRLGVGWNTPRSIKKGHAHVGVISRPSGRHFMRQCVFTWAKFRLLSTESLKNKTRVIAGGKGWFWHGGGGLVECFLPTRDPHSPSCGHFHTHFQKIHISRNAGMRGMRDTRDGGCPKPGGGVEDKTQNKSTNTCIIMRMQEDRHTHTHRAPKWTRRPRTPNSSKSVI